MLAEQLAAGFGEGEGAVDGGGVGSDLSGDLQEGRPPGIASGIEGLAEAGDLLAAPQAIRQDPAGARGRSCFPEQRLHPIGMTAMPDSFESREPGGDHVVGGRGRRGHAAGRSRQGHGLGLPTELFTPIFAVGRVAGWTAHALEQLATGRLIRPQSEYVGERGRRWVTMEEREPVNVTI